MEGPGEETVLLGQAAQASSLLLYVVLAGSAAAASTEPRVLAYGGVGVTGDEAAYVKTIPEILCGQTLTPRMTGGRLESCLQ